MPSFIYYKGKCIMFAEWEMYCIFKEYVRFFILLSRESI